MEKNLKKNTYICITIHLKLTPHCNLTIPKFLKMKWDSLEVQWLGLHTFTVKGTGSIAGAGTKIPQEERKRKEGREGGREGDKEGGRKEEDI